MEIILKGSKEEVIRKMLDDRLFCLIKMPVKKHEKCTSDYSSSIFVSHMNDYIPRTFAVRNSDSNTVYQDCEIFLSLSLERGCDAEKKGCFDKSINAIIRYGGSVAYPTIDELIDNLKGKELFIITNYMHYGNFEHLKVKDFLEKYLLLWKECGSNFIRRDEVCDIRIYLCRIEDESSYSGYGFYLEDVRDFDIRQRIVDLLNKYSKKFFDDELYYSAEYEAKSKEIQAAYYVTRFHSNKLWEADPVNIVNVRISAFVLPGTVTRRKSKKVLQNKVTKKNTSGADYMIDSIHFNSDVFYDLDEFEDFIGSYFCYFGFD